MSHISSTKQNLELLLEWLQTQLTVYGAISIIGPIGPDFHHNTTICSSLLLCLAHRHFPHALPDLIARIDNREQHNTRIAQHLFLKHWNLPPSSNMLSYFSDLYVTATSINHDATSCQPRTTLCLLLEFVHAKLFRSSVLDNGWLEKLSRIMQHTSFLLQEHPHHDDIVHRKYEYLNGWLTQLRCWSEHGQGLYHSLRTNTPIHRASIDVLPEQKPLLLSHRIHHQLSTQPLNAYHCHQFLQRRQQYKDHCANLEATWLDQCDRATHELTPDSFHAAQRAHAMFSGASLTASSAQGSRYRALVSHYNNHQNTERLAALEAGHRHSLDSFLARSDALLHQGAVLKQDMDVCDLDQSQRRLAAFEDDVHLLTERIAPRIPFPNHMDTTEAYHVVSRHKAALWALQNTLQNKLEDRRQKHVLAQQEKQRAFEVEFALIWMHGREKAIREASTGLEAPGLESQDLEKLIHEEEAHHSAIMTFKTTTLQNLAEEETVVNAYDKLINTALRHKAALHLYRAQLDNETAYAEISKKLTDKIKAIWEVVMPLEDGSLDNNALSFEVDANDINTGNNAINELRPAWLARQEQQYRELVDYGQRMMQYRDAVIAHIKRGQDIQAECAQSSLALEEALMTLMTTQSPPPSSEDLDGIAHQVQKFWDDYTLMTKPECSVEARSTRPEPYLSSENTSVYIDLFESYQSLSSMAQSVTQSRQKYMDALDLKSQIDGCSARAEQCAQSVQAALLANPPEERRKAVHLLESVAEIRNALHDVQEAIVVKECTAVVHARDAVASLEKLEHLATNLTQAIERAELDRQATDAEAAWEATYKATRDALDHEDCVTADEARQLYLDMDRAFTQAGRDITLFRARQMQLEVDIKHLFEKQAREVCVKANQAFLMEWEEQLNTAIAKLAEHEDATKAFIEACEESLVPNDEMLEALQQTTLPPTPGPDPRVFDFPTESLDPYFAKMYTIKEKKTGSLEKLYAQARAITTECHMFQHACAAIEKVEPSAHALSAMQSEVARFSGRPHQLLKKRLIKLENQHKAMESQMKLKARRAECEAVIANCRCRLDELAVSTDADYISRETVDVVNQALAELTDASDIEVVQAMKASVFQDLERNKGAADHAKRIEAENESLGQMGVLIDRLADIHAHGQQDHQTMDLAAETTCFAPMKALLKEHPDHNTLQDMYTSALQRHKSLAGAVRKKAIVSDQDHKQQAFEKASAEFLTTLKTVGDQACEVRNARTTDRATLEALEAEITQATIECTFKYYEICGLRIATGGACHTEVTKQFRVTDEMLQDTLSYVNKMKGWSCVREMLDEAAELIHTDKETGPARLLLSQILARMDDDDVDARMQYMEYFNKVCAVEAEQATRVAEKKQEMIHKDHLSTLQRLADQVLTSIKEACGAAASAVDKSADAIQDAHIAGLATLAKHRAQCNRLLRELDGNELYHNLQEALNAEAAVYDMLKQVGEHACEAEAILGWIQIQEASKTLSRDRLSMYASRVIRFRSMTISSKDVPEHVSMAAAVQKRVCLVESSWNNLLERMEDAQAAAARQKRLEQCNAKMDEKEAVLKHATAQLSHIKWHLNDRDLESMLREPEALALEGRINTLAERTTALLEDLQDDIDDEPELIARQDQIDEATNALYQDIQDTQYRIVNALAISEYLMLSDDIDLMLSIFKDHLGETVPTKNDLLQDMLQTLEAQQKYYQEHVDEKLEAASTLVIDNVKPHFEALCERWDAVQQQARTRIATLRQRLQRRGRLASFPTTLLSPSTSSSLNPRPSRLLPPRPGRHTKVQYQADPTNALDLEIGRIVNATQCGVKVEMVPGQSGKYYFGLRHPRLVYCRILKSGMVMVRVGGGWCELSQFLRDHALLEEGITCIQDNRAPVQQGFFSTVQRPSVPQLNKSNSTSTISSTNSTSSATSVGYLVDGNKYMAVDHLGNYHPVRMTKTANLPSTGSGYRSVHMK